MVADAGGAAHEVDPETIPEAEQGGFPKWKAELDAATGALPAATPSVLRSPETEQDVGPGGWDRGGTTKPAAVAEAGPENAEADGRAEAAGPTGSVGYETFFAQMR